MFQPHPDERFHLRLHRARSVVLTTQELVEIRAAQRTFEGAYVRTALGQFSFALIILKVFTEEFYAIGALFAVYGVAVMLVAVYRRYEGQNQFFTSETADGGTAPEGKGIGVLTFEPSNPGTTPFIEVVYASDKADGLRSNCRPGAINEYCEGWLLFKGSPPYDMDRVGGAK
ncbi:hypothetical protein FPSE5266_04619 [Fusarium pseudograminearum]|nr:hypothetical protein FPSE5266_04619 [Fusarium pseudograminearum]